MTRVTAARLRCAPHHRLTRRSRSKLRSSKSAAGLVLLRSILFDIAFLGFGGALLVSTIDVRGGLALLAIGVFAALTHGAIDASRTRRSAKGGVSLVSVALHAAAA